MISSNLNIEYSQQYLELHSNDFFDKLTSKTVFMYGTHSKVAFIVVTSNQKTPQNQIKQKANYVIREKQTHIISIFSNIQDIPKNHLRVIPILATPNQNVRFAYETNSYGEITIDQLIPKHADITLQDFELAWRRTWEKGCLADACVDTAIATMHNLLFDTQLTAYLVKKSGISQRNKIESAMNRYLNRVSVTPNFASIWQKTPNIQRIQQLLQQNNMLVVNLEPNSILEYKIISPISLTTGHVICLTQINNQIYAADNNQLWCVKNINQLFNGTAEKPTKWSTGINIYVINKEKIHD